MSEGLAVLTCARRARTMLALGAVTVAGIIAGLTPAAALAKGPPTLYVSASATTDPACSAASKTNPFATIAGALACAANEDVIKVGPGTFAGGFTISLNIELEGAGANKTIIANPSGLSVPEVRLAPVVATHIQDLTVDGGHMNAGIYGQSGSLTLTRAAITNTINLGSTDSAAVTLLGSPSTAHLTMVDSTVSDSADGEGAIYVEGPNAGNRSIASITNSTISGNTGTYDAGGVSLYGTALTLRDDTISGNAGVNGAGGLEVGYASTANVTNTLIAANTSRNTFADCGQLGPSQLTQVTDLGHDLIGVADPGAQSGSQYDCGFTGGAEGDLTGTVASPLDPHLGALAANGGTTQTQKLLLGSPAIASGSPSDCTAAPVSDLDQRGDSRAAPTRFTCDIGAYDTGGKGGKTLKVSSTVHTNPTCKAATTKSFATIAGALACALSGDTVKVGAGTFAGNITVPANVVLDGAGADLTTISDATHLSAPEVTVGPEVSTTLENLKVSGAAGANGGILATSGALILKTVSVTGVYDPNHGAVSVIDAGPISGTLTVFDSTISGASGFIGGGIDVEGDNQNIPSSASIINSTISGNHAALGGGVYVTAASLALRDDTIAGNSAVGGGGGSGAGGVEVGLATTATVTGSLIATNTSTGGLADCAQLSPGELTDGGHNLIGVTDAGNSYDCGFVNGTHGDVAGNEASPLNPELGPLAGNGGPTQTQPLQTGSPAIGAGSAADCEAIPVNDLDQRGMSRAAKTRGVCDIGAYDTGGVSPS